MNNTLEEIRQFLAKEFKGVDPGRIVISIKGGDRRRSPLPGQARQGNGQRGVWKMQINYSNQPTTSKTVATIEQFNVIFFNVPFGKIASVGYKKYARNEEKTAMYRIFAGMMMYHRDGGKTLKRGIKAIPRLNTYPRMFIGRKEVNPPLFNSYRSAFSGL